MAFQLARAAVIGAGTMGAAIAAHLANAGVPVDLLDIAPDRLTPEEERRGLTLEHPAVRNRIVLAGPERAKNARPPSFMSQAAQRLVRPGNLVDDVERLRAADWIVEAIVENLEVKQQLMARLEGVVKPDAIVSSNTNGIPIHRIAAGRSEAFRRRFLGTHFFNPPRYLKLLELIPTDDTDPEVVEAMRRIGPETLGKGVVVCKDTPNFIGNRIAGINGTRALAYELAHGYTVEEVDAIAGPLIGRPRSATFRLQDIVGLDVSISVRRNLYAAIPHDESREVLRDPHVVALEEAMTQRGWLGNKTGQGFYKEVREGGKREFWPLDLTTFEYRPPRPVEIPSLQAASQIRSLPERLRFLVAQDDRAGRLVWHILGQSLAYAARRVPEIADNFVALDQASRWGFAHEMGPFEIWDALGVAETRERMRAEGIEVPAWVDEMLATGLPTFYRYVDGRPTEYYDLATKAYQPLPRDPKALVLLDLKAQGREVRRNGSASLVDLGDGVLCFEFHSRANALDEAIAAMLREAVEEVERNWAALVVGNQGEHFSAGANLQAVLQAAEAGQHARIEAAARELQDALMALRYCRRPVVAAIHGMTLGGGGEVAMAAAAICAAAETTMGQVEPGVGLVPAAGGCKELLRRVVSPVAQAGGDVTGPLRRIFETIAMAKVSGSAAEAREWGFLQPTDRIVMNRDHLLHEAKALALALAVDYRPPIRGPIIYAAGRGALAMLTLGVWTLQAGGFATEHDAVIARHLASILSGGDLTEPQWVEEQDNLDLERAAFVALCREPKTLERMRAMLATGRPLRN